ncbi:cytolysin (calcineurin-like family phosphatase) [Dyadobacter sp. BE34]|uniref:Cytolysin (Calcineurin-like family phosphatase) n=1 Tax=Dyadobacter fermentans TaxID=94254 RepID=A0ABU1R167_9BACT|nr:MULTISPECIES: DUF5618 family protein [Dyadobacter]MDR6807148.1 cytolysin (calcineurin-like family phosphatase) [Dyadobacter fermentans]MDR7044889.1 cytolysin (calcineurin-like family phosphatase) [Dyadobacter sp. BE242]MDR7199375.1 cytolysin (calcineurin-like family phosphatase) [Dyadobacter sp. BE34]MDR7217335.1 cytolysin (calcineurin-like family phosphatase) [Dyadobacter sp. BE31]MDR7265268.1 cytolysin (calcineurin-like family phosphatase) [Dyadobacter sp. BE32]
MKNISTIEEARRYLSNAKQILREKAIKEDELYKDKKYVKMAGHTAYIGVLEALDAVFGDKKKGRKSVDWYREELSAVDKKMLALFIEAYNTLHLAMSYDGNRIVSVSNGGLDVAEKIINWAEQKTAA